MSRRDRRAPRGMVPLVLNREITTRARERSFLISTVITLLIVAAVVIVPALFNSGDDKVSVGLVGDTATIQSTLEQAARLQDTKVTVTQYADEAAGRAAIDAGDADAVFLGTDRVLVDSELSGTTEQVVQTAYRQAAGAVRLTAAGLDATAVSRALNVPPLAVTALDPPDPDSDARRAAAFFGVLLLYFQLIGYGVWVALGVVEEKSSRVVELLLATLRPWQLLAGKVIGIGLLGLGQLVLTGVVGIAAALGTGAVDVPTGIAGVAGQVLVWFLLGFAFYACLYAALASLVSRQEEVQNVTAPLSVLLVGSFFLALGAQGSPDSGLARVTSIVPPFSTMVMPIRWANGNVPLWEVGVSMLLMVIAVVLLIRVAGRIYAGAVLRSGPRVRIREALSAGKESDRAASKDGERAAATR
jgi:ABC-2 type transport system permease protein